MTAKQYLSQVRTIDMRINNLLEQIETLKSRRERVTSVLTGLPRNPSRPDELAEITVKIWELERKVNAEIDVLVGLKEDIQFRIGEIEDPYERAILEARYLNNKRWSAIIDEIHIESTRVYELHGKALQKIKLPISKERSKAELEM